MTKTKAQAKPKAPAKTKGTGPSRRVTDRQLVDASSQSDGEAAESNGKPKRKLLLRITEELHQKLSIEAVKREWTVPHVAIKILESEVGRKHNRKG